MAMAGQSSARDGFLAILPTSPLHDSQPTAVTAIIYLITSDVTNTNTDIYTTSTHRRWKHCAGCMFDIDGAALPLYRSLSPPHTRPISASAPLNFIANLPSVLVRSECSIISSLDILMDVLLSRVITSPGAIFAAISSLRSG